MNAPLTHSHASAPPRLPRSERVLLQGLCGRTSSAVDNVRVLDLCCGMGGLSFAAREMGMIVVAGVDVNPSAMRTFSRNFPEAEAIEGSVRSGTIPERCRALLDGDGDGLSVVLSGPPCQGFSAAGSRDPKDRRNGVLVAVARAIAKIQPDCALIENVSTVLAEKHGDRLESFRKVLAGAGYHVEKKVLDSSEYGVPQKRRRAFFFVTRRPLNPQRIDDLLVRHKVPPVTTREALHGLSTPAVRPANTLFSGHRAPPAHFAEPRSITVREAARLQGFPDTFRIHGSFANQMGQVTNAVPPPLARDTRQLESAWAQREGFSRRWASMDSQRTPEYSVGMCARGGG